MLKPTLITLIAVALPAVLSAATPADAVLAKLVERHGEAERGRAQRGLAQVQRLWRAEDGDLEAFALEQFVPAGPAKDALFSRLEFVFESLDGHMLEMGRDLRWHSDLDLGPLQPVDEILSGYEPASHLADDLFGNKLGFVVLLNFPATTLEERLKEGDQWTSRQWAEARLVDRFSRRVPAEVNLAVGEAAAKAERYIAGYNIWMYNVQDEGGVRRFPKEMRLLSHWNLRDEIKAQYGSKTALPAQQLIQAVMERIVTQTIPADVIDKQVDWDPRQEATKPEPDTRYATILGAFRAFKRIDAYAPSAPSHIARRFDEDRQIPEARVKAMLEEVCGSPLAGQVARVIEKRLGRKLQPFDIWYNGFRPSSDPARLDALVKQRYPDAAAYRNDMPRMLEALGFTKEKAQYLAERIDVDPARGSGHAMGAARRGDKARLRTRIGAGGMDYKGFNIAVHEMGHNVEQTFSLYGVDHTLMQGVPNTAFTEAMAFVFQSRDRMLLGEPEPTAEEREQSVLNEFWQTWEISGVALVDMEMWHFLYDHPDATPKELKQAVLSIAKTVWNRYYAPVLGQKDSVILAIYSHMVNSFLYLPDYPIGHLIAFQIEESLSGTKSLGAEVERMCRLGRLTPDLWMTRATGKPVSADALLTATKKALQAR